MTWMIRIRVESTPPPIQALPCPRKSSWCLAYQSIQKKFLGLSSCVYRPFPRLLPIVTVGMRSEPNQVPTQTPPVSVDPFLGGLGEVGGDAPKRIGLFRLIRTSQARTQD